jgi:hypothetical protein
LLDVHDEGKDDGLAEHEIYPCIVWLTVQVYEVFGLVDLLKKPEDLFLPVRHGIFKFVIVKVTFQGFGKKQSHPSHHADRLEFDPEIGLIESGNSCHKLHLLLVFKDEVGHIQDDEFGSSLFGNWVIEVHFVVEIVSVFTLDEFKYNILLGAFIASVAFSPHDFEVGIVFVFGHHVSFDFPKFFCLAIH